MHNQLFSYVTLGINSMLISFFSVTLAFINFPADAANPTPEEIAYNWDTLSHHKNGKIVYMTRQSDSIVAIDLKTGLSKNVASFAPAHTTYGLSGSVKYSPDGTRITMQNEKTVEVMNADGSSKKTVASFTAWTYDLISHSWSGNNKIVYSAGKKIVRTEISTDNSVVKNEDLVTTQPSGGKGYCSVSMSGDYLAYIDFWGHVPTGGSHRPLVKNIQTGIVKDLVDSKGDGCQLEIKSDGTGTAMYCEWTHEAPALVKNFSGAVIDEIPPVKDPVNNNFIQHMRWSNDPGFIVVMGAEREPKNAWIVRMKDKKSMYLGDQSYHPDLWVGDSTNTSTSHPFLPVQEQSIGMVYNVSKDFIRIQVPTSTSSILNLYNVKGSLVFSTESDGITPCYINSSEFTKGLYIIKIETSNLTYCFKTLI